MDFDGVRGACYHESAGIFQANLLIGSSVSSSRCRRDIGGHVDVPSLQLKGFLEYQCLALLVERDSR